MTAAAAGPPGAEPPLVYVSAVARDDSDLAFFAEHTRVAGPAGAPLRVVRRDGLGALVSDVPAERFGEKGMKQQLEDMAALEHLARAHHAVVAAAFTAVTVLPMRLACIYADDAGVRSMLGLGAESFAALLDRLAGHREFGVKVYVDPDAARAAASSAPEGGAGDRAGASASPGRDYLRQRRAQRDLSRRTYAEAEAVVERVLEKAAAFAAAHARHRPQQGVLAAGSGENIANLAFLVPPARQEGFGAAMQEMGRTRPGVRVEVTGPWAPYSFATPQDGAADAS